MTTVLQPFRVPPDCCSYVYPFIAQHSFTHSFSHLSSRSSAHPFSHPSVQSFIHLFVHQSSHTSVHPSPTRPLSIRRSSVIHPPPVRCPFTTRPLSIRRVGRPSAIRRPPFVRGASPRPVQLTGAGAAAVAAAAAGLGRGRLDRVAIRLPPFSTVCVGPSVAIDSRGR